MTETLYGLRGEQRERVAALRETKRFFWLDVSHSETGVGWVYEYALVDKSGTHTLAELRSFQDWYLRYWLAAVPGVAEVASVGGFVKQYQVEVKPATLLAYRLPLREVIDAIRRSNNEVGGRLVEFNGAEYMVRGRGYVRSVADVESIAVGTNGNGTPILVRDIGAVRLGPDLRRGLVELDGDGEVVGGVVVMRHGENAVRVIDGVKRKLEEVKKSLPAGVEVVATYDRSTLIERAIDTLKHTLRRRAVDRQPRDPHLPLARSRAPSFRSSRFRSPWSLSFIPMAAMGITANIMSLGGIAVAIGAMVDAAIVVVEQTHKKLERWHAEGRPGSSRDVVMQAVEGSGWPELLLAAGDRRVRSCRSSPSKRRKGGSSSPSPSPRTSRWRSPPCWRSRSRRHCVSSLVRQDPFRFRPAWLRRVANAVLVGHHPRRGRPSRQPTAHEGLPPGDRSGTALPLADGGTGGSRRRRDGADLFQLGSEFMPPLNEGTILYMPTALPGMSITQARAAIQTQDRMIKQFPEVATVFGKAGRAETPTDPAPINMFETVVTLKPESEWRRGMTWDKLLDEIDRTIRFPGMPNIWWMPIQTRTRCSPRDPQRTRLKVFGADLGEIGRISKEIERALAVVPGTRSAFAERTTGGYYLNFTVRREAVARYGLTVGDVQDVIESAIGGTSVSQTVEGRERYSINVRYARDERSDLQSLERVLVPTPGGAQIPLAELADISISTAPPMIHDENGQLAGYVFVDVAGRDLGGYVAEAKRTVDERVELPPGYHLEWAGSIEYLERATARLSIVVPFTLLIVFILLYVNTGSIAKTLIILLAVPFSAVGAIWLLWLLDYNMSIAVWVGLIALARRRRRDRRVHASLSRPRARGAPRARQAPVLGRSPRGDHRRGGQAPAAEGDDRRGDVAGALADPLVTRHGCRRDEAYRRADGRRDLHVVRHGAARLSGDLLDLAGEPAPSMGFAHRVTVAHAGSTLGHARASPSATALVRRRSIQA